MMTTITGNNEHKNVTDGKNSYEHHLQCVVALL